MVVERTGRYHGPVQRAFRQAGFEVRIVHPYTTKQYRLPADPGNKTDDTDLSAIHRAAVNGFGLLGARTRPGLRPAPAPRPAPPRPGAARASPSSSRCSNIFNRSCQATRGASAMSSILPPPSGWPGTWARPRRSSRPAWPDLSQQVRQAGLKVYRSTLEKIVAWARSAAPAEEPASLHHRIFLELDADQLPKARSIAAIESELAGPLAQTPYVLLLGIVGINVVSAAEFAGEMGPIERYPNARAITGRAGLFPSRYQSDQVDRRDGALVRHANRDLRYAILMIADNLIKCNDHFRILAAGWRLKGKDARDIRVRVAGRFCRIAYQMVAGGMTFRHPCARQRDYILDKLIRFSLEHSIAPDQLSRDLDAAVAQLPRAAHREEAVPLAEELARLRKRRGTGPHPLATILPAVLAKLEVDLVRSPESGEADPTE